MIVGSLNLAQDLAFNEGFDIHFGFGLVRAFLFIIKWTLVSNSGFIEVYSLEFSLICHFHSQFDLYLLNNGLFCFQSLYFTQDP